MSWQIATWSREEGRGKIQSELGELEFDGSVAEVDDFVIGERVEVQLQPQGDSWLVARIWPDIPRFRAPQVDDRAPELEEALSHEPGEVLAGLEKGDHSYALELRADVLTFTISHAGNLHREPRSFTCVGVSYLEVPVDEPIDCRFVRLATVDERRYLATRTALTNLTVAVTLVDQERRFFFVVFQRVERAR